MPLRALARDLLRRGPRRSTEEIMKLGRTYWCALESSRLQRILLLLLLQAACALLFGCGAEPQSDRTVHTSENGLLACQTSTITWTTSDPVCAGPWHYDWQQGVCPAPYDDPRCAGKPVECPSGWNGCSDWSFGSALSQQSITATGTRRQTGKTCHQE